MTSVIKNNLNLRKLIPLRCLTTFLVILTVVLWVISSPPIILPQEKPSTCNWQVYFSPHGGCTDAIIRELNKAKGTILVQAYSFTSAPIAKALLDANKRGVKVEVILDKSQRTDEYSSATFLFNAGIPVKIDAQHAIAHNKIMVIDGETVITGSFNFTNIGVYFVSIVFPREESKKVRCLLFACCCKNSFLIPGFSRKTNSAHFNNKKQQGLKLISFHARHCLFNLLLLSAISPTYT